MRATLSDQMHFEVGTYRIREGRTAQTAWCCVEGETRSFAASEVANACTSRGPHSRGWRPPQKRTYRMIHGTYAFSVRGL